MMRSLQSVARAAPRFSRLASVAPLNEAEYKYAVNNNDRVIAGFFKQGCETCKAMEPEFEKLSDNNENIRFLKMDFDKFQNLSGKCGVTAKNCPAVFSIRNGEDIAQAIRASDEQLQQLVANLKVTRSDAISRTPAGTGVDTYNSVTDHGTRTDAANRSTINRTVPKEDTRSSNRSQARQASTKRVDGQAVKKDKSASEDAKDAARNVKDAAKGEYNEYKAKRAADVNDNRSKTEDVKQAARNVKNVAKAEYNEYKAKRAVHDADDDSTDRQRTPTTPRSSSKTDDAKQAARNVKNVAKEEYSEYKAKQNAKNDDDVRAERTTSKTDDAKQAARNVKDAAKSEYNEYKAKQEAKEGKTEHEEPERIPTTTNPRAGAEYIKSHKSAEKHPLNTKPTGQPSDDITAVDRTAKNTDASSPTSAQNATDEAVRRNASETGRPLPYQPEGTDAKEAAKRATAGVH